MAVVIAIIALLAGLGLPAIRTLYKSFESEGGAKSAISAALASARAIAARDSRYAGVRFQRDSEGALYMIFITHDRGATRLSPGFRAVAGVKPIKLPDATGVTDLMVRSNPGDASTSLDQPLAEAHLDDRNAANLGPDGENARLRDTCTFSIIFSSTGKLVRQDVRVRNRDGYRDTAADTHVSDDDIFNKKAQVDAGKAMFYQDDHPELGLGAEPSRNRFVIYDKNTFDACPNEAARFNYLVTLPFTYINAYTGTIVSSD